jgi:phage/plasmid-associated DNA primase
MSTTNTVSALLERNKAGGVHHSHGSMMNPIGNFQFNRHSLDEFWDAYCSEIEKGNFNYGIGEVSGQHIPVLVDVDLKIPEESNPFEDNNLYTLEQVETIINIYQNVLREIVDECADENLVCVFLNKEPFLDRSGPSVLIRNGFHLHFPNLFMDKKDQKMHLLPRVKDLVDKTKLFANIGKDNSGSTIDDTYCTVRWLLYGSKKSEQMNPYLVSRIYDHKMNVLTVEEAFAHYMIFDKNEKAINIRHNVKFYLPRILSVILAGRASLIKEIKSGIMPSFDHIKRSKPKEQPLRMYEKTTIDEDIKVAERLLPMLSADRASEYMEWMTIGWALYNISNGNDAGYKLWLDFSRRCPDKFDETRCGYEWEKMVKGNYTIGTLRHFASVDNPEQFKKFKSEQTNKIVEDALSGTHNDIAKILHSEYSNEYVCVRSSPGRWFRFCGHVWEEIEDGLDLRRKISDEVSQLFREKCKSLYDDADDTFAQTKLKQYQKIIVNLKSSPFKNNVMREAAEVFYNNRFLDRLDSNPYLIAFKNGVYDLEKNVFRAGKPEDFISKTMPINFKNFSPEDKEVREIYTFLEKVFPDKSVRDFFIDINAEIFVGKNTRKEVQMWTGEKGNNGKSVMQRFFNEMLGTKFCIKMETTLITGSKPNAGGAWPELSRAGNGVRAVFFDELTDEEEIKLSMFKKLSGNDTFAARDCFEKGKDMKDYAPMFKMFIISNKLARFHKGGDQASWNRVCVIPFESVFVDPSDPAGVPDTYEEQLRQKRFPMDKKLDEKIPSMVEAFAWILLQRRLNPVITYKPEKVLQAILAYRRRNDIYRQYIEEKIIEEENGKITLQELYGDIKEWIKDSIGHNAKTPEKNEVKDYFLNLWGDGGKGNKWSGYRIRTMQDDIDDGSIVILNSRSSSGKPPM